MNFIELHSASKILYVTCFREINKQDIIFRCLKNAKEILRRFEGPFVKKSINFEYFFVYTVQILYLSDHDVIFIYRNELRHINELY